MKNHNSTTQYNHCAHVHILVLLFFFCYATACMYLLVYVYTHTHIHIFMKLYRLIPVFLQSAVSFLPCV